MEEASSSSRSNESHMIQALREELHVKGFVKIPSDVFCHDKDAIVSLQDCFADLFDGKYATGIYPDEIHWRKGISRPGATREICNGWKADPRIANIVGSSEWGQLACGLMEWKSSRLGQDDVLHKPPQSGSPIGFHQDAAYISDNFSPLKDNSLTMWMALDDADLENGALQYVPGSHLWNHSKKQKKESLPGKKDKDGSDASLSSFHVKEGEDHMTPLRVAAVNAGVDPAEAVASVVTVPVKQGEMVVHHQDVWHGSGPNCSATRHRRALVAHLLNGNVQWRASPSPHYIYGRYYIRGETIPREDFFPFTFG